jgi:hypothetical protein
VTVGVSASAAVATSRPHVAEHGDDDQADAE